MTTHAPDNKAVHDELQKQFAPILDRLEYLHDRWQDEKEYEDWNDYVDAMQKLTPTSTTFMKATKRPFGFEVKTDGGGGFQFFANTTSRGFHIIRKKSK